ncbi:MAG: hypothetical protein A4S09_10365 [Proteobacteria bacterium SG_bin7]|nr:MAG: hypothetical protein A4S09_10365 [Proteobacteria bacterium SG_bin7]
MKLDTFEFQIYKKLKNHAQQNNSYLLGVSGGMDSMVLLHAFHKISKKLEVSFSACHVHHGTFGKKSQVVYREKVKKFVAKICADYQVSLLAPTIALSAGGSEAEMRDFRLTALREIKNRNGFSRIVLAHHQDDLLETRVIRLIRGTGPQGLVSMQEDSSELAIYRPLLDFSQGEIKKYAKHHKLKWLDDPSNRDEKVLRNWVRKSWLPALEKKRVGGINSLGRSLALLAQFVENHQDAALVGENVESLDRSLLSAVGVAKKQQMIAGFLRRKKITNYSLNQINEVIKRLNTKRKYFHFVVAKVEWQVGDKLAILKG